jgi:hypothetical protein
MFAASLSLNFAGASILHPSLYLQLSTVDCRLPTNCPILRTYEKRVRNMCKMNRYKMIRVELTQNEHLPKKGEGERMRSSSLFCSSKNLNLPVFMLCRTLSQKTPGVGVPPLAKKEDSPISWRFPGTRSRTPRKRNESSL